MSRPEQWWKCSTCDVAWVGINKCSFCGERGEIRNCGPFMLNGFRCPSDVGERGRL